jgi:uncharacterized protein YggU (UPF0235/DUF167 family)
LTPRASADRLGGVRDEADGGVALKAAVTAPPEDGRANAALVALLAKALRVPKSAISVVAGAADRRKTLWIEGDPVRLLERLTRALPPGSPR